MAKKGNNHHLSIHTFRDATKDFLARVKVKDSSFSTYSFICERHLLPFFRDIELDNIDDEIINQFIKFKLENGGLKGTPISPKTINDMVNLLMQIVRSYSEFDLDIEKLSSRQKEISVFTEKEYYKLKNYLSTETDSAKLGIITTMLTGIRLGELCALKWDRIDLANGFIHIDKTMQRIKIASKTEKTKIIIDTPKSEASIRTIPISTVLLDNLKQFESHSNSYLLTSTPKFIEPRSYQRYFKSCLVTSGVNDNKFHTLRHTFATMAIARGMDIKTLSVLLGHTDVSFTMKRYVHPNMEHKRVQIEKLAAGF